jgi:ferric-dicitrate binding protein FerR (iron transport regulator)
MNKDILYRFFEGNCTETETNEIRKWIEASSENREKFFKEGKMHDAISLLASDEMLLNGSRKKKVWLRPIMKDFLKIAASVIITVTTIGIWQYTFTHDTSQGMNTIHTPAGKNANLVLPDGTKVWLNAKTTIQYPSSFEKDKREIYLDGEAYFEVNSDKKKPFFVRTKDYNVKVLGTKFNVEAYAFEKKTITSLLEGSVQMTSLRDTSRTLILQPHHLAYMENEVFIANPISNYNQFRWKEGLICFDNISFSEILKMFEKYYDIQFVVENKKMDKYLCTGKFRQSDGLEYALRVLQKDVRFEFERVENSTIIYIK